MKIIVYNKKKRRKKKLLIWMLAILAVLATIICIISINSPQNDAFPTEILGVPMHTELVDEGHPARPGIERKIKYVVIHETGNFARGADAKSHSTYLAENNTGTTSWHYTVDETSIYHHIPDTEVAWHAGDSLSKNGGNLCGIGVEICVNKDGDFKKAFDNAAKLTAYLIDAYHLSLSDIRQHADFISKNCPETIRNQNLMDEFTEKTKEYLQLIKK